MAGAPEATGTQLEGTHPRVTEAVIPRTGNATILSYPNVSSEVLQPAEVRRVALMVADRSTTPDDREVRVWPGKLEITYGERPLYRESSQRPLHRQAAPRAFPYPCLGDIYHHDHTKQGRRIVWPNIVRCMDVRVDTRQYKHV